MRRGVSVHVIHEASRWVLAWVIGLKRKKEKFKTPLADKTSVPDDAIKADINVGDCLIHVKYISCRKVETVCMIYHFSHTPYPDLHH
jgi:hypothetical protein